MISAGDLKADILILRHGSTEANQQHQYCGRSDLPLSADGRRQAERTRDWLTETRIWPSGRPVICSPLQRCRETASILWPEQVPEIDGAFVEADFGAWEGKTWADLQADPDYRAWIDAPPLSDLAPPGGESRLAVHSRACAGLQRLLDRYPAQPLALVTHGGVIMTLLAALAAPTGDGARDFYRWQCQPAEGFLITNQYKKSPDNSLRLPGWNSMITIIESHQISFQEVGCNSRTVPQL